MKTIATSFDAALDAASIDMHSFDWTGDRTFSVEIAGGIIGRKRMTGTVRGMMIERSIKDSIMLALRDYCAMCAAVDVAQAAS